MKTEVTEVIDRARMAESYSQGFCAIFFRSFVLLRCGLGAFVLHRTGGRDFWFRFRLEVGRRKRKKDPER